MKNFAKNCISLLGYKISKTQKGGIPLDFDPTDINIIDRVKPYTMTSYEAIRYLIQSAQYISNNSVPGAFVECGVWKGGSAMAAALSFIASKDLRDLYLIDAYDLPLPKPIGRDIDQSGNIILGGAVEVKPYWAAVTSEEVEKNISSTGYPHEKIYIIKGLVQDVLPSRAPEKISILRLDTDTYESTLHNLSSLYERVVKYGILILDDYGTHQGVQSAVTDFFDSINLQPMVHRIDFGSSAIMKTE